MNQSSPICVLYLSDASNNEENGRMKRENSDDHTHFFCSTKLFLPSQRQKSITIATITFLAPLAIGQRAYVMVRCPSCVRACVRASVRVLTFSSNIFFSETTYRILMKFHRNVPTHGPLQNFLK